MIAQSLHARSFLAHVMLSIQVMHPLKCRAHLHLEMRPTGRNGAAGFSHGSFQGSQLKLGGRSGAVALRCKQ